MYNRLTLAVTTSHVHAMYVETTRRDTNEAVSENYFIKYFHETMNVTCKKSERRIHPIFSQYFHHTPMQTFYIPVV